jgi:hypothetical protein
MTLGAVQVGDVVLADRKGRRCYAIVTGRGQRELQVEPIDRRVTATRSRRAKCSRSGTSAAPERDARQRTRCRRHDDRGTKQQI